MSEEKPISTELSVPNNTVQGTIVCNVQSAQFIQKLKEDPLRTIAEVGFGLMDSSGVERMKYLGRVVQSARAGNATVQFFSELGALQAKGDLQTDAQIASHPYAVKSLIDVLNIIDNNPEEDRLKAIKAMFFFMVGADEKDMNDALAYELFEISKKLSSSQLRTLRAIHELSPELEQEAQKSTNQNPNIAGKHWLKRVADKLGHSIVEIAKRDTGVLEDFMLFPPNLISGAYHPTNFRLTTLGDKLYEALNNYRGTVSE